MNRQEALELMYIDDEAFNLINLTNKVAKDIVFWAQLRTNDLFYSNVSWQLFASPVFDRKKVYEPNMNILLDKVYEALKESFNSDEIDILERSDYNSNNYGIMYGRLYNYFDKKTSEDNRELPPDYCLGIQYDKTYKNIFKDMKSLFERRTDHNDGRPADISEFNM